MSISAQPELQSSAAQIGDPRVVSIDIFRGMTMAVMIFVNALSDVRGLPWWTYHAHAEEDVMTYVDMVFPFFLFIIGMSLPLSIARRLRRNPSMPSLWLHVLIRVVGLLALGLILANAEKCDPARMPISGNAWGLLGLFCAGLYLNVYEKTGRLASYSWMVRGLGLVGVIVLFAIFRRSTADGQAAWIDFSYPEILGLIALSYLAVVILYIPTRRWRWAPAVWFTLLLALCVLSTGKVLAFPDRIPLYLWPFGNGAMACIIMAGAVTSSIFCGPFALAKPARAIMTSVVLGILMLMAGWILTPFGISKIRATPTWSLYSIGAAILMFTFLYWVCDLKRWTKWALIVRAAGDNTLTTYLLPDLWYYLTAVVGFTYIDTHLTYGWPAVVKTFAFTVFILALASALTRAKVRLQF